MAAFIIAMLFGIGQTALLNLLVSAITSGKVRKAVLIFIVKLVTYGTAIALLVFFCFDHYLYSFFGFAVGMPLSAVLWFIYKAFANKNAQGRT